MKNFDTTVESECPALLRTLPQSLDKTTEIAEYLSKNWKKLKKKSVYQAAQMKNQGNFKS